MADRDFGREMTRFDNDKNRFVRSSRFNEEAGEIGRKMGAALQKQSVGLELLKNRILERNEEAAAYVERDLPALRSEAALLQEKRRDKESRIEDIQYRLDTMREDRRESPTEYSWFRGVFYTCLSILLIFADISILAIVSANLMGLPFRDEASGRNFLELLFNNPLAAYQAFPEVLFFTLSVLGIGFFIKVWLDIVLMPDRNKRFAGKGRLVYVIYTTFFILSAVSVALMAGARLIPEIAAIPGDTGAASSFGYGNIVLTVMGFALPYVSVGFFMRGLDCLGNSLSILYLWLLKRVTFEDKQSSEKKIAKNDTAMRTRLRQARWLRSPECFSMAYNVSLQSFLEGFQEGLRQSLNSRAGKTYRELDMLTLESLNESDFLPLPRPVSGEEDGDAQGSAPEREER
ncbi:hypothetical protein [Desulfohalovibrio reitneri]|uniref:hypothetical protein n=1 Tax=Desulfohalovibrio reitneri TaxID=1307759 RepID=UPI0004A6E1AE|nr:hypothetical protein [Desulfohalovibrio reitneri]